MPKLAQFMSISALALLAAGCDQSSKLSDVAANNNLEVTHGEGAEGGHGRGLTNLSAELPDAVPPSSGNAH